MKSMILLLVASLYSLPCAAHVKWFVADEGGFDNVRFQLDTISIAVGAGAFAYLLLGILLQWSAHQNVVTRRLLFKPLIVGNIYPLLKLAVFILLLGNIIQGHFLAPNIPLGADASLEMLVQAILIILLSFDSELFALTLLVISCSLFYFYGADIAVDYFFELISIAIAVCIMSPIGAISRWMKRTKSLPDLRPIGLTVLRIGLGVQLSILALHDKLLNPGLCLHFLQDYPYFNFMSFLGLTQFTDVHFVLGAGLAEFSFGLLLATNIAQRMASVTVLFFFTITGILLGPAELLGHVPIMAVAFILLLQPAPKLFMTQLKSDTYGALKPQVSIFK